MPDQRRRKPVRAPADTPHVSFSLADGALARRRAEQSGLTLGAYFAALLHGATPPVMPASFARLGTCVVEALHALENETSPAALEAVRLLREAQGHGAAIARGWLPAFEEAHAADEPWTGPDRAERVRGAR